jgi:cytidyltransferase-like protein
MITGLTTGCFDLLHYSHLLYLQRCRSLCDRLYVGVDSDEMVRKAKGPNRPIIPENERFDLVNNLMVVSGAFVLRDLTELPGLIRKFEIDKVFKHESFWNMDGIVGLEGTNAKLVIVPDIPGMVSTSAVIDRILERYGTKRA